MTTPSAANSARFFTEAIRDGAVWTVRDADGMPAPMNASGERAMPFWSLRTRAERVREISPEYHPFEVVSIPLDDFQTKWLPGLSRDGLKVGVNWAGARATGYDLSPEEVETRLDIERASGGHPGIKRIEGTAGSLPLRHPSA
ncbi:DUF2750 domain-containing protein [Promicromonospora soli]|uniref:DUF2750 domain-containing protein n=1 Tax=Promicromonospora soli TaxID=2035533 RepID=A0A919KRG2_9MICO|nr:DUF2750 domain-containing protein [Promicromonospora soli]GHH69567.1 hypothetical protein GCM10017772_14730 [Promicromonospora soli]